MDGKNTKKEKTVIPGVYARGNDKYRIEIYLRNLQDESTRFRKSVTLGEGLTQKERKRILTEMKLNFEKEIMGEINRGSAITKNQTFSEFIAYWRQIYAFPNLQSKTIERYDELSIRTKETLGEIRLCDLTPSHFNQFYHVLQTEEKRRNLLYVANPLLREIITAENINIRDLAEESGLNMKTVQSILKGNPTSKAFKISKAMHIEKERLFQEVNAGNDGLSNVTILHYSRFIKAVLNKALEWEIFDRNPAAFVRPPKDKSNSGKAVKHYDKETVRKLLEELKTAPLKYRTMLYIAIFSGCRIGELVALEWKHINFNSGEIRIEQSAQRLKDKRIIIKEPKSKAGIRNILIPLQVMELLQEYRLWQQEEMAKISSDYREEVYEGYLFTQENGTIIYPSTPAWWFRKFIKERGLPKLSFHGLRHTHATFLLEDGTPINIVSNRLGHSRISTTVDTYVHVSNSASKEAVEKLNSLLL